MTITESRIPDLASEPGAIEVHRLTASSARSCATSAWPTRRTTRRSSPRSRTCSSSTRSCSSATRTSAAPTTSKLAERFGPLEDHPALGSDPDHPGLVRIYKDLDSPAEQYENAFHCDATWREAPPFGSVLRCVEGPAVGGDTIWVNMAEAYRRLPEHVKTQIAGLRARHSIESTFGASLPIEKRHALHERFPDAEHPVVRTHPETGEKVLFVNAFTTHFTNFHTADNVRFGFDYSPGGSELLNYLIRQAAVPEYQVRWRWTTEQLRDLGQPLHPALRRPGLLPGRPQDGARRDRRRADLLSRHPHPSDPHRHPHCIARSTATRTATEGEHTMHFHDDALFPEVQEKLVITAAPYGPEWEPADFREDLPLTMDEHVQQAVDCWNAGATVLHIHVRELDGKGSKRLSQFNELLGRLREAVPEMILQVGGSISFSPEGDGADAKWLADDARHMLAELDPKPDQVTIAINTNQMNIVELMTDDDIAGTSFERPEVYEAYREMVVPAGPEWVEEHLKRLTANGIQPHFQLANIRAAGDRRAADPPRPLHRPAQPDLGGDRRRLRRPEPLQHDELHQPGPGRRDSDPGDADAQRAARSTRWPSPWACTPAAATRTPCGAARARRSPRSSRSSSSSASPNELGREVATGKEAHDIYRIGQSYDSVDETLADSATRPTASPASSASPSTPEPTTPRRQR